jgi:hypothetical protein
METILNVCIFLLGAIWGIVKIGFSVLIFFALLSCFAQAFERQMEMPEKPKFKELKKILRKNKIVLES